MDATTATHVRELALFRPLAWAAWERLWRVSAIQSYRRGEYLFTQGDEATAICVVLEGWVHLLRSVPGRSKAEGVVVFTVTPAETLCGLSALEGEFYTMSAVAATACQVVRIPQDAFQRALEDDPRFAGQVLRLCLRRMRHMAEQYGTMAEAVSTRLARTILRLQTQFGETIPVTHRELAQMAWTTTESAIRAVRLLKRKGLVAGQRGKLIVHAPVALHEYIHGTNGRAAEPRGVR